MDNVIKIFNQIKNTSGTNEKKSIIIKNKESELFKTCLKFLLDKNIVTGISSNKIKKKVNVEFENTFDDTFKDCMNYLIKNNTGTDLDIARVQHFINSQNDEHKEFYTNMVTKKFKLGVDKKLVNKCIPNLIPSWDIQQAHSLSEKNEPKENEWFCLTQKLNGTNNGFLDGKNRSRQGKEFVGLNHITEDLNKLSFKNMFFNGEFVRKNIDNIPDEENFQLGTGIINSDENVDKTSIEFIIYEMFPKNEFLNGESELTYRKRREKYLVPLENEIKELGLTNIKVVPIIYEGTDKEKIKSNLKIADILGYEGLMLNKDEKWKNKRNNGILKVKSFINADILCTGVVEGEGKYKGTLGLIECDYKGYKLGVGSGFTDEQRNYYWENRDEIIGRVVQIKYKAETKNKKGGLSAKFPIFQCVREKGKKVSYEY